MPELSRRSFLRGAAATATLAAFPSVITSTLRGQTAPSNRIHLGIIGTGGIAEAHMGALLRKDTCRIVGLCDVDRTLLSNAAKKVKAAYGEDVATFSDFRELNQREDIDAILVCTPDHWHALPAIDAVKHGKDILVEKPLTLTIREGQALVAAVRANQRVGQTGTQQRSANGFRKVANLIRNHRLGKLERIEILIPGNNKFCKGTWAEEPVPEGLDWNFWLGPAPEKPFTRQGCHYNFRFISDYARGQITNWGTHYVDIAQWALDMDASGPIAVEGSGVYPTTGIFDNAASVNVTVTYPDGTPLHIRTRTDGVFDGNIRFFGERGWIDASRDRVTASTPELISDPLPSNAELVEESHDHHDNFFEAIRTRKNPIADVGIGHRTNTVCIISDIAMKLGRKLTWDPKTEAFDDPVANRFLGRAMRSPWTLV